LADEWDSESERLSLLREVRQRLESLGRAGVDRVPGLRQSMRESPSRSRGLHSTPPKSPAAEIMEEAMPRDSEKAAPRPELNSSLPRVMSIAPALAAKPVEPPEPPLPPPSLAALFSSSGFDSPPVPACDRPDLLSAMAKEISVCCRCPHLAETRTQTVFGVGKPDARLMFIGEAPGADEDRLGEPFVGRAGQLLTDMITKGMGLAREEVYIANILKCRPPENRNPTLDEANNCFPYLEQQIAIIRPEFLCLLGRVAVQAVLNTTQPMGKMRGKWHRYRGIPTLATYHPSYLLRTPSAKKDSWEDLQMIMKEMGLVRPAKK
jgi:uracil-DNA glycosylase family 4